MKRPVSTFCSCSLVAAALALATSNLAAQGLTAGAPINNAPAAAAAPAVTADPAAAPVAATAATTTTTTSTALTGLPVSSVMQGLVNGSLQPGFGRSRCGHVINMLMRNLMHEQALARMRQFQPNFQPGPLGGMAPFGPQMGDLELIGVHIIGEADEDSGPVYELTILNDSRHDAEDFRVTLVAVLGGIAFNSPTVSLNVDHIDAGGTATLQVTMPMAAMAIGPQGEAVPFDTLIVAIDSFDELLESDELNNVVVLQRAGITTVTTTVEETAVAPAAAPVAAAPAAAAPVAGAPAEAVAPDAAEAPAAPAPNNQLDIDNLDLGDEADEASQLFVR